MEMVLDVVALLDRINKLENETKELRAALKAKGDELSKEIQEVQDSVWEQIPKLKDKQLVIETSDDKGNTVYAQVKTEQIIHAEAEQ